MRINITREEYEKKSKTLQQVTLLIVSFVMIGCIIVGYFFSDSSLLKTLLFSGIIGLIIYLILHIILKTDSPPIPPFDIYEFFESKGEKVTYCENIGIHTYNTDGSMYDASNYFLTKTDKNNYVLEIKNGKVNSLGLLENLTKIKQDVT